MNQTVETCRRVYNELLEGRTEHNEGLFEQKRALTARRKEDKFLKQVHSQVLQDVPYRLDRALRAFRKGMAGHPNAKRVDRYNSFTYPQLGGFKLVDGRLRLSAIGKVRIRLHREIVGRMKTCTIVRYIDQWYACIAVEVDTKRARFVNGRAIGVDLGVSSIIALSNGVTIPALKSLKKSENEIMTLQKALSRKRAGSKNREKAKTKLAKAWRKVRNRREDFVHKASHYLATNYSTIVFEALAIPRMVKNHNLAAAIMDACWGSLRQKTAYKTRMRGGRVILVDPRGTSQKCSSCGKAVEKSLAERIHLCPSCGLEIDRDVNAARNILARGLEQANAETEPLPASQAGKLGRGSMKLVGFGRE